MAGRHLLSSTTKSSVSSKPEPGKGKKKGLREEEKKHPPPTPEKDSLSMESVPRREMIQQALNLLPDN